MNCPNCNGKTKVWWTEKYDSHVQRTRICPKCNVGFKTVEEMDRDTIKPRGKDSAATIR
ncbi:NrdR family transcriptional regulator [Desulforhopalus singaporensis]|uniref:Transcriptional repressor NrdR-like N-terminal domain-containing protein n=1 Tax=Desulforhopalus singaporensis TaxID=91360 RepID=A0A1H0VIA3_9BACT|nr:hypothetical protein SAMN05660330_04097 [Desulforhopalus singaporensis]SDP84489.1 hypothetical protein SAMN05660330_04369 [Desulforhopalus singaporensis]